MDALRLSRCTKNWKCVVGRGVVEHNKRCHVTVSERVPRDQVTANLLEDLLGEPALAVVGEDVGGVIAGPQLIAEDSRGYDVYTRERLSYSFKRFRKCEHDIYGESTLVDKAPPNLIADSGFELRHAINQGLPTSGEVISDYDHSIGVNVVLHPSI